MRETTRLGLLFFALLGGACTDTGPDAAPSESAGKAGAPGGGKAGAGSSGGGSGGTAGGGGAGKAGSAAAAGNAGVGGSATGGNAGKGGGAGSSAGKGSSGTGGTGGTGGAQGGIDGGEGGDDSGSDAGEGGRAGSAGPGSLPSFELAVIGSSTAAGEGASSSSRGWVSLLSDSLEASVTGTFSGRNLAVGGYATSNLLPGSDSSGNVDDAIELEPNLIIVALAGSNDLSNGVSTSTFLARLATIRDAAVDAGIPIFFVSTAPKDLGDDEQEALADWTSRMRDSFASCWTPSNPSYAPCFIDIFDALANSSLGIADDYSAGDGVHLNDAGHARIFELAEPVVRGYVCTMTECG